MRICRLSSLALAVSAASLAQANGFNNTIFFGDSLTDSGYFKNHTDVTGTNPAGGKFTTNPGLVWSEYLALRYGLNALPSNQSGTNYAAGGARIAGSPGVGSSAAPQSAPPLTTQLNSYLSSTGGVADANTLYTFWGGANDIFWAATLPSTSIPSYIQSTIGSHVTALKSLQNAGARYILVPNLPDIGKTPYGQSLGATAAASLTTLSKSYGDTLYASLLSNGVNFIPADTFSLLNEVAANPLRYGFTNATLPVCGTTSSLVCSEGVNFTASAAAVSMYADGVHPTSAGHLILADYYQSLLTAPGQIAQLANQALYQQRSLQQSLQNHSQQRLANRSDSRFWLQGNLGKHEADNLALDSRPYSLTLGWDASYSDTHLFGLAIHSQQSDGDWGQNGSFSQSDLSLSAYSAWQHGPWQVQGSLNVGSLDQDSRRQVSLGQAKRSIDGNTAGSQFGLDLQLAYHFQQGAWQHGPLTGLSFQSINIDAFKESDAEGSSTAISYGAQKLRSSLASLGWQAQYQGASWQPYASLRWQHELQNQAREQQAGLGNYSYRLPVAAEDDSYALLVLGAQTQVGQLGKLNLSLNHYLAHDQRDDTRVNLSLQLPF